MFQKPNFSCWILIYDEDCYGGGKMTVGLYLNMEVLLAKSVEDALSRMTNENTYYDENCGVEFPSYEAFENNFQNGFSAVLGMCAYVECSLNSLIRLTAAIYPYPGPDKEPYIVSIDEIRNALKLKMKEKARWIIDHNLASTDFRGDHAWQDFLRFVDLRNDLIHYKANWMQEALIADFSCWKSSGALICEELPLNAGGTEGLGAIFTQNNLRAKWDDVQAFVSKIASTMGCHIRDDAMLIDSDGRDGFADYFVRTDAFLEIYPDGIRP